MIGIHIILVSILLSSSTYLSSEAKSTGYRSSVLKDGRPILRYRDNSEESEDRNDETQILEDTKTQDDETREIENRLVYWVPEDDQQKYDRDAEINSAEPPQNPGSAVGEVPETWIVQVQHAIEKVQRDLGYSDAQPFVQKLIDDAKRYFNVDMQVTGNVSLTLDKRKEADDSTPRSANVEKVEEAPKNIENRDKPVLRVTDSENVDLSLLRSEPEWIEDMKAFVKHLIARFGKGKGLDSHIKPVVKAVERANNVRIEDIDGNIEIAYYAKKTEH